MKMWSKNRIIVYLSILLIVSLFFNYWFFSKANDLDSKILASEKKISQSEGRVQILEKNDSTYKLIVDSLNKSLLSYEGKIDSIRVNVNKVYIVTKEKKKEVVGLPIDKKIQFLKDKLNR